jgi:hypothetical protein
VTENGSRDNIPKPGRPTSLASILPCSLGFGPLRQGLELALMAPAFHHGKGRGTGPLSGREFLK